MAERDSIAEPNYEEFLERMREKQKARPPDGAFAEYVGKIALSVIDQVKPLPLATVPEVVDTALATTPWGTPNASSHVVTQLQNPGSLINRALWTCLDEPAAPESMQVFGQLSGYVEELPTNILDNDSEVSRAWMQKITVLVHAYELVIQKEHFEQRAFGANTTTAEMQAFTDALVTHIGQAEEVIKAASSKELLAILGLMDAIDVLDDHSTRMYRRGEAKKIKVLARDRRIPKELYQLMSEARLSASTEGAMDLKYMQIEESVRKKLDELQTGWEWKEVNQVLAAFGGFTSDQTRMAVIDALEDTAETSVSGSVSAETLATGGLAAIIHYDIYQNVSARAWTYYERSDKFQDDAEVYFGDIVLPHDMAPVTTLALLTDISEKLTNEDFVAVLRRMQETICGKSNSISTTANEWLVVLALLRETTSDETRSSIDAFIAGDDFPHTAFRQIIAGEKPGHVYLVPGGKIRVDAKLSKGWVLATSPSAPPLAQTDSAPADGELRRFMGPEKGVQIAPGKQTTRRERKKERAHDKNLSAQAASSESTAPVIVMSSEEGMANVAKDLSRTDLAIVRQAIHEHQTYGRHPLTPLRGRTPEGALMYKMRVNGVGSGIRVILAHVGGNHFEIRTVKYRGSVYKTSFFK